jgi:hypothetical protein
VAQPRAGLACLKVRQKHIPQAFFLCQHFQVVNKRRLSRTDATLRCMATNSGP